MSQNKDLFSGVVIRKRGSGVRARVGHLRGAGYEASVTWHVLNMVEDLQLTPFNMCQFYRKWVYRGCC